MKFLICSHTLRIALLAGVLMAGGLAACSQAPQPTTPPKAMAAEVNPHSPQVLIKLVLVETDEAAAKRIFEDAMGHRGSVALVEHQTSTLLKELAKSSKIQVTSRPYMLTLPEQTARLKLIADPPLNGQIENNPPPSNETPLNLTCTAHVTHDQVTLDLDLSKGAHTTQTRVSVKNGETIAIASPEVTPAGNSKVQLVFITPHVAMDVAVKLGPQSLE